MRIGIIGLRGHADVCLAGMREVGACEIVAVSDADVSLTDAFCREHDEARDAERYADWRHLVEHTMMDLCVVVGETGERAEQLAALAERGIHICSEKPLTTTLDGLAKVRAAVAKGKVELTMLLTMRHQAKYVKMRELIAAGAIGTPALVTSQKSYRLGERPDWQKSRERFGGTIPFIAVHALDLMQWVPQLKVTHVAAFHANVCTPEFGESEDAASVLVRFENGASGTARLDYLLPETFPTHGDDRFRIIGGDGVLEVRQESPDVLLTTSTRATHAIDPGPDGNLFADFLRSLKQKRPSRMPTADALAMTELVLRTREAADRKELVALG